MALSLQRYARYKRAHFESILKERIEDERQRLSMMIAIEIRDVDLPENVIVEILSWLPVKSLLQFKTVCKSWHDLISSPVFISKHLQNYYKNNIGNHCVLVQHYVTHAELQLFHLLVDDTPTVLADQVLYGMPMYGSYVCGPCDGIYFLYNYYERARALWNPAINELKVLPPIITKPDRPSNLKYGVGESYGFGYDPTSEDYKVVVFKECTTVSDEVDEVRHLLSVLVYSLRTDSWRYCGDLTQFYDVDHNWCYTLVNGCYYWLGSHELFGNPAVIISFDMVTESIQEMHLPDHDQRASKSLGIYDDSLAFLAVHENEKRFDVWTWNEGVWTKKFTMGPMTDVRRPVGHWMKNKLILEGYNGLVLCDPDTQEIKELGFKGSNGCRGFYVYRESLLSINDRRRWGHNEEDVIDTN